jgi:transposase InsO family protein
LVHAISLAHYAFVYTRSWAANGSNDRVRLTAKADQLEQEVALQREEIRIKDTRMAAIPPARRPHYGPTERLAILELRAARSWSQTQTAQVFQVTEDTIASWSQRLDEEGPAALLRTREPVNKFPDFVRYLVQRLQTLCPRLGKVKIAQILTRAGLHLGVTTIGRMRRDRPKPTPRKPAAAPAARRVTARHPNHVWHVDLTTVPTSAGHWVSWLPFALPLCWPFCWWLAVVLDHYSRRVMGITVFTSQPSSLQVQQFLGQVITKIGAMPRHLISDHGGQFDCSAFRRWCKRRGMRQRMGAVGKHGSIAVVERFIKTLKFDALRQLAVVPLLRQAFQRELSWYGQWYNEWRPHTTLAGATPNEVYFRQRPACRRPRFEPRPSWPRASPCAKPQVLVKGQAGAKLDLTVEFVAKGRHLPVLRLTRAA